LIFLKYFGSYGGVQLQMQGVCSIPWQTVIIYILNFPSKYKCTHFYATAASAMRWHIAIHLCVCVCVCVCVL
jgi:hypothetical protein